MADEDFKGAGFRSEPNTQNPPFSHCSDLPRSALVSERETSGPDFQGSGRRNEPQKPDRHYGSRPPKPRRDQGVIVKRLGRKRSSYVHPAFLVNQVSCLSLQLDLGFARCLDAVMASKYVCSCRVHGL